LSLSAEHNSLPIRAVELIRQRFGEHRNLDSGNRALTGKRFTASGTVETSKSLLFRLCVAPTGCGGVGKTQIESVALRTGIGRQASTRPVKQRRGGNHAARPRLTPRHPPEVARLVRRD
jgi:hypothetical protein